MVERLTFWKYQGLGNDFVLIERPTTGPEARTLCDRDRGLGADGVIVVAEGRAAGRAAVTVWNSDGSPAEICGNGLRCVALHLGLAGRLEGGEVALLRTPVGVKRCRVSAIEPDRGRALVEVEMGRASLTRGEVGVLGDEGSQLVEEPLVDGPLRWTAVGMGNPHAVTFAPPGETFDLGLVSTLGPRLERHELFPRGVNVGFAAVEDEGHLALTVWERGAGLTGACGSGACAAVVAGCRTGRLARGAPVIVTQPGGELTITVGDGQEVSMRGPAQLVYQGETRSEYLSLD